MKKAILIVLACFVAACNSSSSQNIFSKDTGVTTDSNESGQDGSVWDEDVSVSTTVGTEGGTVEAGSVSVEVPDGALAEETEITVETTQQAPEGAVGATYEIEAGNAELAEPVTLTFKVAKAQIPTPYLYSELKLGFVNDQGQWEVLPNSVADESTETVSGTTTHLSLWGILPKVKMDILWVIDSSASMCQENMLLVQVFDGFTTNIQNNFPNLDLQVAVTDMNAMDDKYFLAAPASAFPPSCMGTKFLACNTDEDCNTEFGGSWTCKAAMNPGDTYNLNGSVNSLCRMNCESDEECCPQFCLNAECNDSCIYECSSLPGLDVPNCQPIPSTADCPAGLPTILTNDNLDLFHCLSQIGADQSYQANLEQGFKSAWQALDPEGNNPEQSEFLRDDAFLLMVFVTDEDDCSIDVNYSSPSYNCNTDEDCQSGGGTCKEDKKLSEISGNTVKTCHGVIKKDYFNSCDMLGEFVDLEHHECAYDVACEDCTSDADCPEFWGCQENNKCRPQWNAWPNIASYASPPGTPIFSLSAVSEAVARFQTLKTYPEHLMVAAIAGDGMVLADDAKSLVSQDCLEMTELTPCQNYVEALETTSDGCKNAPEDDGCEEFHALKLSCIRACYIASRLDPGSMTMMTSNTYVCNSETGLTNLGLRYINFVDMFSEQGSFTNICGWQNLNSAADSIASMVKKGL
jgi:hypothetical protein